MVTSEDRSLSKLRAQKKLTNDEALAAHEAQQREIHAKENRYTLKQKKKEPDGDHVLKTQPE